MQTNLRLQCQRGASAIIIALLLGIFVALVALVIDVGYGLVVSQELNHASDAAALHAARELGKLYEKIADDYAAQQNFVLSADEAAVIRKAARDVALSNQAGGQPVALNDADIHIGVWNTDTNTLTESNNRPTGVAVLSRRNDMDTFFAKIFGIDSLSVASIFHRNNRQELPTAALTGVGHVAAGELELPIGISEQWFMNKEAFCDQDIQFYPTGDELGCAGWHTFDLSPSNASTLRTDILDPLLEDAYDAPAATAGDTQFDFSGGNVASALPDLRDVYLAKRVWNDETGRYEWSTWVVVYESSDCSNPSGLITIAGFAQVVVTDVLAPPEGQLVKAEVKCDTVQPNARGGGSNYGPLGSIPQLVQ